MNDASRRGRRNRAKGGEYEREVSNAFQAAGIAAIREGFKQRRKGDKEPDVAAGLFAVECKCATAISVHTVMEQAEQAEGIPVLFWKRPQRTKAGKVVTKKSEVVVMRPADFLAMAAVFARVMGDAVKADPVEECAHAWNIPRVNENGRRCERCGYRESIHRRQLAAASAVVTVEEP